MGLIDIIIIDPNTGSTINLETGTATINLEAGTYVSITFVNKQNVSNCKPCKPNMPDIQNCKPLCRSNK